MKRTREENEKARKKTVATSLRGRRTRRQETGGGTVVAG